MGESNGWTSLYFHLSFMTIYGIAIGWFATNRWNGSDFPHTPKLQLAGMWKFLNYWTLVFQFFLHFLNVYLHFIKAPNAHRLMSSFRDLFHHAFAFPFAMHITILFWVLRLSKFNHSHQISIDFSPPWINHISYSLVGISSMLSELFEFRSRESKHIRRLFSIFSTFYIVFLLYLGYVIDFWVYPFLEYQTASNRLIILIIWYFFMWICYAISGKLHSLIWSEWKIRMTIKKAKGKRKSL